jgi:hypothetical protein
VSHAIVQPVLALMLLTFAVWVTLFARRIAWMVSRNIDAQRLATPEQIASTLPESVNRAANNFRNLFELPVVFYAICLLLLATQGSDAVYVNLAWGYVALRVAHSLIHCTVNIVTLRFAAFALSSIVLWIMLARLVLEHF